jgi:hypothetical protein
MEGAIRAARRIIRISRLGGYLQKSDKYDA